MALTTLSGHRLRQNNPAAKLQNALSSFEQCLNPQQRDDYHQNAVKPTAADVHRFVVDLDTLNDRKERHGVSARVMSFLQSVQHFTGVVDTMVQSNPAIPALVWGALKATILAAIHSGTYYDEITKLIMQIQAQSPILQDYEQLYPTHRALQKALCDYYAETIHLCVKIVGVAQRSNLNSFLGSIWTPFEVEFAEFRSRLKEAADNVRCQIDLASKQELRHLNQLQAYESEMNNHHRLSVHMFQDLVMDALSANRKAKQYRRLIKTRMQIQNLVNCIDYTKPWKRNFLQRVSGTADWYADSPSWKAWMACEQSSLLHITGNMGVGKTILAANLIAKLTSIQSQNVTLAYNFCQSEIPESLCATNIFRSILYQLLKPDLESFSLDQLESIKTVLHKVDEEDLAVSIAGHLVPKNFVFLVLDGMDECTDLESASLTTTLSKLLQYAKFKMKVVVTTRPLFRNIDCLSLPKCFLMKMITQTDDIARYVTVDLREQLLMRHLKVGSRDLLPRIESTLIARAQGSFLWARLMIGELCTHDTDHAILQALQTFPVELSELLNRILERVFVGKSAAMTLKALQYSAIAKRPLTCSEIHEALSVEEGQHSLDASRMPNDLEDIVRLTHGLLCIDEEDDTLHFIHPSIKDHLCSPKCNRPEFFRTEALESDLGRICLTYLNFIDFRRSMAKYIVPAKSSIKPIQLALSAVRPQQPLTARVTQALVTYSRQMTDLDVANLQSQARERYGFQTTLGTSDRASQQHAFLRYAKKYWLSSHTADLPLKSAAYDLFCNCLDEDDMPVAWPWPEFKTTKSEDQLCWACENSHFTLVRALTTRDLDKPDVLRVEKFVELVGAMKDQRQILSHVLLQECLPALPKAHLNSLLNRHVRRIYDAPNDFDLRIAEGIIQAGAQFLYKASNRKHDITAAELKAALEDEPEVGNAALLCRSILHGLPRFARVLGKALSQWEVPIYTFHNLRLPPLHAAVLFSEHVETIQALISSGAPINAGAHTPLGTPLYQATKSERVETIKILLRLLCDVNAPTSSGKTPLSVAILEVRNEIITQLLLASGAKVDVSLLIQISHDRYASRYMREVLAENGHIVPPRTPSPPRTSSRSSSVSSVDIAVVHIYDQRRYRSR